MNIGEAANQAGLPVKTVRYYSDIGLVLPSHRSTSGYRNYDSKSVKKLIFVFIILFYPYLSFAELKEQNYEKGTSYIESKFKNIKKPNPKIIFDLANFYKNSKNYELAIDYYTKLISSLDDSSVIKSDILYRRGGSYERLGNYEKSDEDLLHALRIRPDDAYVLNYLAYSWLERDYKIDEAMEMLKIAYNSKSNDPYIIDSIGWAYFLIDEYEEAEKYLKRAVELMPDDPIVNDHYGDILWKLDQKIQARYFWNSVLSFDDTEDDMRENINKKLITGLKSIQ